MRLLFVFVYKWKGMIPFELGQLFKLIHLQLNDNELTGNDMIIYWKLSMLLLIASLP